MAKIQLEVDGDDALVGLVVLREAGGVVRAEAYDLITLDGAGNLAPLTVATALRDFAGMVMAEHGQFTDYDEVVMAIRQLHHEWDALERGKLCHECEQPWPCSTIETVMVQR